MKGAYIILRGKLSKLQLVKVKYPVFLLVL